MLKIFTLLIEVFNSLIDEDLLIKISDLLKRNKLKIATAESCTGGLIAHTLTNVPGSSEFFDRGIVSYSNESKIHLLNVPQYLIIEHGAVSSQVAIAMAEGIKNKSNVDIGISTTGIAGPTGETKDKPIGLVFIGVNFIDKTIVKKFQFKDSRLENKENTCNAALKILYDLLTE